MFSDFVPAKTAKPVAMRSLPGSSVDLMRRGAVYSSAISGRTDSARAITATFPFFPDPRRFLPRGADGPQRYTLSGNATIADLLALIGVASEADVTAAVDG